jgi:phosphoglycerate dehydrogenase-like enzyme
MNIYCAINLSEEERQYLKSNVTEASFFFGNQLDGKDQCAKFLECEICFGNVPPFWLESCTKLQWIQLESVGFGEYQNITPGTDYVMTNLKGFFAQPVAESALAGILSLTRGIDELHTLKNKKTWRGAALRPHLRMLKNSQVLIVGNGTIGRKIEELLLAFQSDVSVFDKYDPDASHTDEKQFSALIQDADIIINCLPETNETIKFMNRARLSSMKPGAIFVNVGRGTTVDEAALVALLNDGHLGGAVLDVTSEEPLPADHPLWVCSNSILTQHTGGGSVQEIRGKVDVFLENYALFASDKSLNNKVDLKKGY